MYIKAALPNVGLKSEDTEEFFCCQNRYSKLLLEVYLNKLFTVLGGKLTFSAQDSDLEYLFLQRKKISSLF